MPFNSESELPDSVKRVLPVHAQSIYRAAFNSAYEEYDKPNERRDGASREETSHRVAWSAVKKGGYQKGDDELWHKREES